MTPGPESAKIFHLFIIFEGKAMPTSRQLANAIRFLSIDAVQKANSGHPGMPMGMADIAEVLWNKFLNHNPLNPQWINRDRFVLSNGHGCMLLYALLHLTGYDLSINDLKNFRQLHSKTPGHPEYRETPGVETTTGPLGQGLANAVGMAIAEKHLAAVFNREDFPLIDHYTYVFMGDGCLMEGISHEACSLAGALGLGKLIAFYDDNGISIDGEVKNWFQDDTPMRFRAYGWHVIDNIDGHDSEALAKAIMEAKANTDMPSIICCKTVIGWGSPNMGGTAHTHGSALGETEVAATRQQLDWHHDPFVVPEEIYTAWDAREQGKIKEQKWNKLYEAYQKAYPNLASELKRRFAQELPANWKARADALLQEMHQNRETVATRKASKQCLDHYAKMAPELVGGSADLTESNCALWDGASIFKPTAPEGRFIHYGVREFGMSAIMNGMAAHGGIIPYGGTFLTFSDYARNAIRLAALMHIRSIFVYTHDSIGLGEDGPTHQPIEHIPSLRLIPKLSVWRPCDTVETAVAWRHAIEAKGPTCLLLSRQNLSYQERDAKALNNIARGGYILRDYAIVMPDAIVIATGSEVDLAIKAAEQLKADNIFVRVVSMPSTDTFLAQDQAYQNEVLPKAISARIAIEAAASDSWYRFVGPSGKVLGIDRFGASAPAKDIYKECGLTLERVISAIKETVLSPLPQ
jgi:transketolase